MRIIAYLYGDPILEPIPQSDIWGAQVEKVYLDFGKREQLQKLLEDCLAEPPDRILLRRLEELGDSVEQISDRLTRLEALGIEIIATEQNYNSAEFNSITPSHLRANLTKLLQEIQNNQRRRKLKQGHARNRIKALPPPGKAPYGYRRGKDKYIIDRTSAPVVKDFFERFLLFGSLRGAVRYLERRYGKKISVSTGHRWLTNPVYRGDLEYQNREIISDTHAPIISREEAAQIDRLLRRNGRLPARTASAPRSLAGLVFCQHCHSSMSVTRTTTRDKKREYLYLRCLDCPKNPKCGAISYQKVLETTIERICEDLPKAVAKMNVPSIDGIKTTLAVEIDRKREILARLPSLQEQGILDEETMLWRSYKIRAEISQIQNQIARLPPVNLQALARNVSIAQFWLDLSETERRFYFREFIRQIEIINSHSDDWQLKLVFIF